MRFEEANIDSFRPPAGREADRETISAPLLAELAERPRRDSSRDSKM